MRNDVLAALARQGAPVSNDGTIRLYHATRRSTGPAIEHDRELRLAAPDDAALRVLRPGGTIWLASRPSILDDLAVAQVVLAISIQPEDAPEAEVLRDDLGDPPRVDLELAGRDGALPLTYVADLFAPVPELSPAVASAVNAFAASPVGQQLADPRECRGRCKRTSQRFISALRNHGADGRIIEWAWHGAWHNAVVVDEHLIIDWTAAQFDPAAAHPDVGTRAQRDLHMLTTYGAPAGWLIDPDDPFLRRHVDHWERAQERIPTGERDAAAFAADRGQTA